MHSLQVIYLKWPVIFILCSMLEKESDPFNNANGQGSANGDVEARKGSSPQILSKLQESWSTFSHATREVVTLFSVTLL